MKTSLLEDGLNVILEQHHLFDFSSCEFWRRCEIQQLLLVYICFFFFYSPQRSAINHECYVNSSPGEALSPLWSIVWGNTRSCLMFNLIQKSVGGWSEDRTAIVSHFIILQSWSGSSTDSLRQRFLIMLPGEKWMKIHAETRGGKKKEERETTARLLRDERRTAFTLKCTNSSIFRLLFEIPHRQQSSDVSASEEDSLSDTTAAALICRCSGSCWRSEWITGCWRQTHSHRVCST